LAGFNLYSVTERIDLLARLNEKTATTWLILVELISNVTSSERRKSVVIGKFYYIPILEFFNFSVDCFFAFLGYFPVIYGFGIAIHIRINIGSQVLF